VYNMYFLILTFEKILNPYCLPDNGKTSRTYYDDFRKYFCQNIFYDHLLIDQYVITRTTNEDDLTVLIDVFDANGNILALTADYYCGCVYNENFFITSCAQRYRNRAEYFLNGKYFGIDIWSDDDENSNKDRVEYIFKLMNKSILVDKIYPDIYELIMHKPSYEPKLKFIK